MKKGLAGKNEWKKSKDGCVLTGGAGSKFLAALAQDGGINEEQLSVEQLERVYGPLRQQVTDSVRRQEGLLDQIQARLSLLAVHAPFTQL